MVEGDRKSVDVRVPAGVDSGMQIRLSGKGGQGDPGAPSGDLFVQIEVEPDSSPARRPDIHVALEVPFADAALGATVDVLTLDGIVQLKVPRAASLYRLAPGRPAVRRPARAATDRDGPRDRARGPVAAPEGAREPGGGACDEASAQPAPVPAAGVLLPLRGVSKCPARRVDGVPDGFKFAQTVMSKGGVRTTLPRGSRQRRRRRHARGAAKARSRSKPMDTKDATWSSDGWTCWKRSSAGGGTERGGGSSSIGVGRGAGRRRGAKSGSRNLGSANRLSRGTASDR